MNNRICHVYDTSYAGRSHAIQNLQFALEDVRPWFLNVKFLPNKTAIAKGKFANWITKENFDQACKAIFNALEPIRFYQFLDMVEVSDEHQKLLMNWKENACKAEHSLIL